MTPHRFRFLMPTIISVCLLSACTEVIDIDLEQTKPYIVVNSIIDADTTVKVSLSYSRFFLEGGDFRKINDANVVVKRNGSPMTLSSADQGDYIFAETVHAGDILDLCVVVPGYDTVTASTQVPSTPDVSAKGGLRFVEQRDEYGGLSVTGRLTLRLYDKPGVQYYYVQIFSHINSSDNGSSKYFICNNPLVNNIASSDILSQLESELDGETNELYFSDELFDGKDIDISLIFPCTIVIIAAATRRSSFRCTSRNSPPRCFDTSDRRRQTTRTCLVCSLNPCR